MDARSSKERDVFTLLTRLKASNGAYPPELITLRRQKFIRRAAEINVGLKVAPEMRPNSTIRADEKQRQQ